MGKGGNDYEKEMMTAVLCNDDGGNSGWQAAEAVPAPVRPWN